MHTTALFIERAGELALRDTELSHPQPGQATVEIVYGGICGSDLHYWQHGSAGNSILRNPMVLGHEVVGIVVAVAEGAASAPQEQVVRVGDTVAVHPARSCGHCVYCEGGTPNLCRSVRYLGSAQYDPHTDGAFATAVNLPVSMLRVVPSAVPLKRAALVEPASVAWHGVSQLGEVRGKHVFVVGAGPIGLLVVAALVARGAERITVTDLAQHRLDLASQMGASNTYPASELSEELQAQVDADAVIECSGSVQGLAVAFRSVRSRGDVVMLGNQRPGEVGFLANLVIGRELSVHGSFRFNDEIDEVISAMADGRLSVEPIVSQVFPLERAEQAFATAANPAVSHKVLIDFRAKPQTSAG